MNLKNVYNTSEVLTQKLFLDYEIRVCPHHSLYFFKIFNFSRMNILYYSITFTIKNTFKLCIYPSNYILRRMQGYHYYKY